LEAARQTESMERDHTAQRFHLSNCYEDEMPAPQINPDKVCHIIFKARQFDVKEEVSDPDSGSNAADDGMTDVLEDTGNDAVRSELVAFIHAMDIDEQLDLVALAWVGRGTYGADEWNEARQTARSEHTNRTATYLLGMPLLGDYLSEGLAAFDMDCSDFEDRI
jgi:hypothetical protein